MKKMAQQNIESQLLANTSRSQYEWIIPSSDHANSLGTSEGLEREVGMGRRQFLFSSILAMASFLMGRVALARGRFCRPVKLGHHFPKNTLFDKWAKDFMTMLRQIDNKIEVEIIPQVSPLKLIDSLLRDSSGSFDLALVSADAISTIIPEWRVLSLPALYPNLDAVKRLRHNKIFFDTISKFTIERGAFPVTLGWGFYGIATRAVAIRTPEDMKGLKIQAWTEDWRNLSKAASASPVTMPYREVSKALEAGTIEGTIDLYQMFEPLGFKGIIKNLTWSSKHSVFSRAVAIISGQWFWNKTGKDLQPKLLQIASKSAGLFEESHQRANVDAVRAIGNAGVKIIDLTEEDFKKWLDLSKRSAWKKYEQEVPGGKELLELTQQ